MELDTLEEEELELLAQFTLIFGVGREIGTLYSARCKVYSASCTGIWRSRMHGFLCMSPQHEKAHLIPICRGDNQVQAM